MGLANNLALKPVPRVPADVGVGPQNRKHKRVLMVLLGRFMRADKQEFPCRTKDISVSGASICSSVSPEMGEFVVAYFDAIGGVRGKVVRVFDDGFAMKFQSTSHKQEKLAAELTWLINRDTFGTIDERRHDRRPAVDKFSVLSLSDNFQTKCEILDVSLAGAMLATEARPAIGSEVVLGKQTAVVRRHHETGIGIQFIKVDKCPRSDEVA